MSRKAKRAVLLIENETEDATVEHFCCYEGSKPTHNSAFAKKDLVVLIQNAAEDATVENSGCLEGPKTKQN